MTPRTNREVVLLDLHQETGVSRDEILEYLSREHRSLPAKLFYDARGSQLFDEICELEEYYLTRTETGIMETHGAEIGSSLGPGCAVIELGSGSSLKTRILLDHLEDPVAYLPIDVSREHLLHSANQLAEAYPDLEVLPICADFTDVLELPKPGEAPRRKVVYFPGSTVGNFLPSEVLTLFRQIASKVGPGGALLLGADLRKDPEVLVRAYDDAKGVTAQFNLNVLRVLNRELGADFDVEKWEHVALYNSEHHRIEMHLRSIADQTVDVGGRRFTFARGETIHTENSHKYDLEELDRTVRQAGLETTRVWTDEQELFAVILMTAQG